MIGLVFRGIFFFSIISWYSYGVFKMINDYFRSEYKNYLDVEVKKNKYLIRHQEVAPIKSFEIPQNLPNDDENAKLIEKVNPQNLGDDESILNYWSNHKIGNNDNANDAHCDVDEKTFCKNN